MFTRILVAVDDSAPATRAVEVAIEFARQLAGARLVLAHVVDTALGFVPELAIWDARILAELRSEGEAILAAAAAHVPPDVPCERKLVEGDPAEMICSTAREWEADLIVIGTDSRGRLAHFLLGSTADSVIRRAACPVISVRATVPAEEARPKLAATVS